MSMGGLAYTEHLEQHVAGLGDLCHEMVYQVYACANRHMEQLCT